MAKRPKTYLIDGQRYTVGQKGIPADAKKIMDAREKELSAADAGTQSAAAITEKDIDTGLGTPPVDDSLPADFPGLRSLQAAGYTTYTALGELEGDYQSVKGIGKETAEDIALALEERSQEDQEG
jgi:hypothetical protein